MAIRTSAVLGLAGLALCFGAGCKTLAPNPLDISETFHGSQDVRERISHDPYSYFRYVNVSFAQQTCQSFSSVEIPIVNLHGDPHIEQFAVTQKSAGLVDFDDSVAGPAVIDLVRFGTSIKIAARQKGWTVQGDIIVRRFLDAYRATLAGEGSYQEPQIVQKIRNGFAPSRQPFLDKIQSKLQPIDPEKMKNAGDGYRRYVELMIRQNPQWDEAFFKPKSWGQFGGGIGSQLVDRHIMRIEGPTSSPEDDIILEAKEVRDLSKVSCLRTNNDDGLRVIAGSQGFNPESDPFLAVVPPPPHKAKDHIPWWVQSWNSDYGEVRLKSLATPSDLEQIALASAERLALGHVGLLPSPADQYLKGELIKMVDQNRAKVISTVDTLTHKTLEGYEAFVQSGVADNSETTQVVAK